MVCNKVNCCKKTVSPSEANNKCLADVEKAMYEQICCSHFVELKEKAIAKA